MAIWSYKKLANAKDAVDFLNGAIVGKVNLFNGADVDGLTIVVDIGGGDVTTTFAPAKSRNWTIAEIISQINTAVGSICVSQRMYSAVETCTVASDKRLSFMIDGGMTVKGTGTGNAVLGFPAVDVVQAVISDTEVIHIAQSTDHSSWSVFIYN